MASRFGIPNLLGEICPGGPSIVYFGRWSIISVFQAAGPYIPVDAKCHVIDYVDTDMLIIHGRDCCDLNGIGDLLIARGTR